MLHKIVFYFLVTMLPQLLSAQEPCTHLIEGHVYDIESHEPLIGATVQLSKENLGAVTDIDGYFSFANVCSEEVDITISYTGYKSVSHHHDFHHPPLAVYLALESQYLSSIIVEGKSSRSGMNNAITAKLSTKEMVLTSSSILGQALANISGMSMVKTGQNVVSPMLHGLSGNRILIINNGVKHEYQSWDNSHAPEIDLNDVSQIEVVKGAATVRFGPEAIGGVVLLNPEEVDLGQPLAGQVGLQGQTNGRTLQSRIGISKGWDNITIQGNAKWYKQGDLQAPTYNLSNTGRKENSLNAHLRWHLHPDYDIKISLNHFGQELGILRGGVNSNLDDLKSAIAAQMPNETKSFTYNINSPSQKLRHRKAGVEVKKIGHDWALVSKYAFQENNRKEFDVRRGNALKIPNINIQLLSHIVETEYQAAHHNDWTSKWGVQFHTKENRNIAGTNTIPFIPNYTLFDGGLYSIVTKQIGNHNMEVGARYDLQKGTIIGRSTSNSLYEDSYLWLNPTFLIAWLYQYGTWSWNANLGNSWRAPSIGELYRYGRRATFIEYGLLRYQINGDGLLEANDIAQVDAAAKPERGLKLALSNTWKIKTVSVSNTIHINKIDNYIYAKPAGLTNTVRGAAPLYIYTTTDAIFSGWDMEINLQANPNWNHTLRTSVMMAKDINKNGNLPNTPVPAIRYTTSVIKKFENGLNWKSNAAIVYNFQTLQPLKILTIDQLKDPTSSANEDLKKEGLDFDIVSPPAGYMLIDLGTGLSYRNYELNLSVYNVLNKSYRSYTDQMRYFADDQGINLVIDAILKF